MKLLKAKIFGEVQGVGFRFETMQKAHELGLRGFVKNERDGTVSVEAQGPRQNIARFLHWLEHHGPANANIIKVEHHETFDLEDYGSFRIKY